MEHIENKERTTAARQRSDIYGLLATVYSQEVTSDLLDAMKETQLLELLSELGHWDEDRLFQKPEGELLEDLAVEYARLFLGPGRHISPHESVHHPREDGQWGQLWGKSTANVKRFIEAAGFHYKSEYRGLPDHIGVELEFMEHVTRREAKAWAENDKDRALYCREIERKFFDEHLGRWIPIFCEKVSSEAVSRFYRDIAVLTNNFLEFEKEEIDMESVAPNSDEEI
jgi:TorA maturation chaperone TorD